MAPVTAAREILFIAHRVPFPPDRGDKIRSYNILRHLARIAPVHLAALADDPRDMDHDRALADLTASHCVRRRQVSYPRALAEAMLRSEPLSVTLFRDAGLSAYVRQIVATRPLAAVFVYSGNMAIHVPPLPAGVRYVMDFCDVDSLKFATYGTRARFPMSYIYAREGHRLGAWEAAVSHRADASVFVSRAEADAFANLPDVAGARIGVLENGVDLTLFDPAAQYSQPAMLAALRGRKIVFTGQMDYRPNIEAVTDFATAAFPLVRTAYPDAHFLIVGRNPSEAVRALESLPGVHVTGEVADTRPYLAAADVVVAPLRIARGVQNKVLEAMAMARPVVASAAAAEGVDAVPGAHLLVAEDSIATARLVNGLLADGPSAQVLGAAGRRRVEQRYSWDAALASLGPLVFGT